jgi:hypothetical protein
LENPFSFYEEPRKGFIWYQGLCDFFQEGEAQADGSQHSATPKIRSLLILEKYLALYAQGN